MDWSPDGGFLGVNNTLASMLQIRGSSGRESALTPPAGGKEVSRLTSAATSRELPAWSKRGIQNAGRGRHPGHRSEGQKKAKLTMAQLTVIH